MKLRLSKHTTFCIMIGIFITTSFHISTPAYGNNPPLIEIYCLEDEFPKIIDRYIDYIKDSLSSITNQKISNLYAEQDFCYEQAGIMTEIPALLPYTSIHTIDLFDQLLTLINEINRLLNADFNLFVFFFLMIIGVVILKLYDKLKRNRPKVRRSFSRLSRENVLRKQNYKCDHCRKILTVIDFHHRNGDRSDNRERNCQALCPTCHAIETRGLIKCT